MENVFGKRMREERTSKKLTQQQLADIINSQNILEKKVSRASITRYENGTRTPDFETLSAIGSALDIDIDYLIGRSDYRKFDFKIISDDFKYLMELIEKSDDDTSKIIIDIIDKMFLTIFSKAQKSDIEYLQTIYKLYDNIWKLGVMRNTDILKNILLDDSITDEEEYTILKNDQINLLNKLDNLSQKI